jgi:hypothetical protein
MLDGFRIFWLRTAVSVGLSLCARELSSIPLEPLLAGYAAKIVGFAIMGDLELSCFIVQNCAAHRISRHMLVLWRMCVLLIMISVKGRKKVVKKDEDATDKSNIFGAVFV